MKELSLGRRKFISRNRKAENTYTHADRKAYVVAALYGILLLVVSIFFSVEQKTRFIV